LGSNRKGTIEKETQKVFAVLNGKSPKKEGREVWTGSFVRNTGQKRESIGRETHLST